MSTKRNWYFVLLTFFVFVAILPLPRQFSGTKTDPDRFYHFAISKIYATSGFPKTLPQAEDVGWGEAFAEKEYFFHVLTGLGHKIGGEMGVLWVTWALYAALAASFGFILAHSANTLWLLPVGAVIMIATTGIFSLRMMMVRPHVLAILLMTWQIFAWSRGAWVIACVMGALYTLAYHAFYIPLAISVVFLACQYAGGQAIKRQALWAFGGILIAILINPAFPYNVSTSIQVALIVLTKGAGVAVPELAFGGELRKLPSDEMLRRHGFYLLLPFALLCIVLFRGIWRLERPSTWRPLKYPDLAATIGLSILFAVLTFLTPRAYEILVPTAFIAVAITFQTFPRPTPWILSFCGLAALAMAQKTYDTLQTIKTIDLSNRYNTEVGLLLAQIPTDQPAKIYNLNWDMAPYIFYHRPDLKFVDLLDPTFLARKHPDLFDIKWRILTGRHPDPWLAIRGDFHADYVLSYYHDSNPTFENPMFEPMELTSPKDPTSTPVFKLFKVKKDRPDRFITSYQYGVAKVDLAFRQVSQDDLQPRSVPLQSAWPEPSNTPSDHSDGLKRVFLDTFGAWLEQNPGETKAPDPSKATVCLRAKPQPDQLKRLISALPTVDYLGIGGGPLLTVWAGATPLFKSQAAPSAQIIHHMLHIKQLGTKALHDIEFMVCTPPDAGLSGLTVSFWSQKDLQLMCTNNAKTKTPAQPLRYTYELPVVEDCLSAKILEPQKNLVRSLTPPNQMQ
jgi:hypothetical protein